MAKLSARGRREWLRAKLVAETPKGIQIEHVRVYLSDGSILQKVRPGRGRWWPWRRYGKWSIVTPLPRLRSELSGVGWQVLPVRGGAR